MAANKHKGLPKKIKQIVEEELQALNEVKPFVDNRLRTKYDYPKGNRDSLVYLATNDNRYPTEIVLYNQKRDVFHFVYSHSGEFTAGNTKTQTVPRKGFNSTHYVMPYFEEWEEDLDHERGFYEGKINEADRTSSISKQRAKAELKQQLKGKRADGLGDYTAIVYGMDGSDRVPLKGMNDINKYSKFEIGDNEDALKEVNINEAKSAKALKADYEKAIKKEQALSSLMLMNLQKYKAAKASGDEKAIAKFTKIAGQLSPKKKKASELASAAYQAYEDKISGLHADAELQIDEALARGLKPLLMIGSTLKKNVGEKKLVDLSDKFDQLDDEDADSIASHLNMAIELMQDGYPGDATKKLKQFNKACKDAMSGKPIKSAFENVNEELKRVTKPMWDKMDGDARVNVVLTAVKDPDEAEQYFETEWEDLPSEVTQNIYLWEGKLNEAEDYKYKKYVTKAFDKISDAMFEFRHAMGVKQLGQADPKLKNRLELMQAEIFSLRRDMKSGGLTESKLNEIEINDPVLVAMRAFKTQLKKDKLKPKTKKISMNKYFKLMDMESDLIDQMKDAAKELAQLDSEMNQEAGQKGDSWSDADANRYGGDLDKLQTKYEKLAKQKAKVKKAIMDYRIS